VFKLFHIGPRLIHLRSHISNVDETAGMGYSRKFPV
jgi:hypothetical protein